MVELKLDVAESASFSDCFVSVRVGDTQKLSRLQGSRVYNFPQAGERRYGKIEVYRRIGACGVDVDPLNEGTRQVQIGCGDAGTLRLDVEVNGNGKSEKEGKPAEPKEEAATEKSKSQNAKSKVAKEYLRKHSLELQLSEAMQAVLRARPENPVQFLADMLLKNVNGGGVVLPTSPTNNKVTSSKPEAVEPAPAPKATPKAAEKKPAEPKSFGEYYTKHCLTCPPPSLYSRFQGPKKTAPPAPPAAAPPAAAPVPEAAKEAPPAAAPAADAAPPPQTPFHRRPSVGSWLAGKPKVALCEQPAAPAPPSAAPSPAAAEEPAPAKAAAPVAASAPVAAPAAPPQWFLQPSIGTWHAKISKVQAAPAAAASKEEKAVAPAPCAAAPAPAPAAAAPATAPAAAVPDPVPRMPPNLGTSRPFVAHAGTFGPTFNTLRLQPRMVFL